MSSFSTKTQVSTPTDGNVLTIKTVQISPFRTLMTALKDILLETNITFEPDGIRIINMDKSHTILAHLYLAAQNFESYECKQEKIIIGVNMFHLFKLINTIDNDDTLTIYIENNDYNDGVVNYLGVLNHLSVMYSHDDSTYSKAIKTANTALTTEYMFFKHNIIDFLIETSINLACFYIEEKTGAIQHNENLKNALLL